MGVTFKCPSCGSEYTVDGAFEGRRGRCKHCGTLVKIPASGNAKAKSKKTESPALGQGQASWKGENREAAVTGRIQRPVRPESETSSSRLPRTGAILLAVGILGAILASLGYTPNRIGLPPGPTGQTLASLAFAVAGLAMLLSWFALARAPAWFESAMLYGGIAGVLASTILATALLPGKPVINRSGPQATIPQGPYNPKGSLLVTLTKGRCSSRLSPLGSPMPGLDVVVDYRIQSGWLGRGENFLVVVASQNQPLIRERLLQSNIQSTRGTLRVKCSNLSPDNAPFQAWLEVASSPRPDSSSKVVSQRIDLKWSETPEAGAGEGLNGLWDRLSSPAAEDSQDERPKRTPEKRQPGATSGKPAPR